MQIQSARLSGVLALFLLVYSVPPAHAADELVSSFYDDAISDATFLELTGATKTTDLEAALTNLEKSSRSAQYFSETGTLSFFDYTPAEYNVVHAINYYVPNSYRRGAKAPVLIVLHGGGGSTNQYETSRSVSQMYMRDFIDFAERNGVILIGPSSRVGWSYVTRILVEATTRLARQHLSIDSDRVIVWGHSMGGMGSVREGHWMASRASAIMPNSAGMQDGYRIDPFLRTYFDTRLIHANGIHDHFSKFDIWTKDVESKVKSLEAAAGAPSGYEVHYQERGHNMDMAWNIQKLESDVLKTSRDKYQSSIHPIFVRLDALNNRLGPDVNSYLIDGYFWLQAPRLAADLGRKEFDQGENENFEALSATVAKNRYVISAPGTRLTALRVLISSRMVDLSQPITIVVNGQTRFSGTVTADPLKSVEIARSRKDPSMIFDSYVDISL